MTFIPNSPEARDVASQLHGYTNARAMEESGPLMLTEGKGVYVKDNAGKQYLEAMSGLWCASLGFDQDRLVKAATDQLKKLPYYHTFNGRTTDISMELAEKLLSVAPVEMSKVFFCGSGSEANDTIVKFIRFYHNAIGKPQKKKIISRDKAYHGTTMVAASLCGLPHMHAAFDLPIADILHTDCPHYYRFAEPGETEEDFATRLADNLEKMILDEGPDTVAAFFAEPVMGAGGVIVPPKTYFEKVQKVLKKYDVLFVADEVICGFARTGQMFGSQTYDIRPDFMTVAKALSSAYLPIAGVLIREEIFQAMADQAGKLGILGHGYTYSGHPVASAVALETLKIYEEIDIVAKVQSTSRTFMAELEKFQDHPLVGETRGVGLVGAIELVTDKGTRAPVDPKGPAPDYLYDRIMESGLITRPIGNSIAFCPPLIISPEDVQEMFQRFRNALDRTLDYMTKEGMLKAA